MRIALVGDIALFGRFDSQANPCVLTQVEPIAEFLHEFDLVVGNLETPLTTVSRPYGAKSAHLKGHPRSVELLKHIGVHAVSLANNHISDYGRDGIDETIEALEGAGILWAGVDGRHATMRFGASQISLRSYCSWNTNPLGMDRRGSGTGVNPLVIDEVRSNLLQDNAQGFLPIISVHSGDEHIHAPSRDDIRMARGLAKIAPFVYHGHHPHVIQALEQFASSNLAYSLGNFCFDDVYSPLSSSPLIRQTKANLQGLIVELDVQDGVVTSMSPTILDWADGCRLVSGSEAAAIVAQFALPVAPDWGRYEDARLAAVAEWRNARRDARDLHWYWKRLHLRSVRILLAAWRNRQRYSDSVAEQLESLPTLEQARTPAR